MSDELENKDELLEEDEELMSDFKDLFDEDDESGDASDEKAAEADESLDELDAFLDEFEKNIDVPDAEPEEASAQREELDLDEDELNLDVDDGDIGSASEDEVSQAEEELDLDLDVGTESPGDAPDEEPEGTVDSDEEIEPERAAQPDELAIDAIAATAATVTPTSVAAATAASAPAAQTAVAPANKTLLVAGIALLTCSTLLSVGALWIGMGLGSRIDVLNENVSELQQRVLSLSRRGVIAPQVELSDQLNRLGERVNELAVIVEGPVGHMREINQQALKRLDSRLTSLEAAAGKVPTSTVEKKTAAPTQPRPLVKKITTVRQAPAPAKVEKQGWVINLLTVASAKTASEELARLRGMGVRADKQSMQKDGKTLYRLRVTGFDSYEGAKAYIETVEKQTGFSSAWVAKE